MNKQSTNFFELNVLITLNVRRFCDFFKYFLSGKKKSRLRRESLSGKKKSRLRRESLSGKKKSLSGKRGKKGGKKKHWEG